MVEILLKKKQLNCLNKMARKKRKKEKRIPVLLLEDHPHLGQQGTVVLVKPGYFRYLVTNKKAVLATQEKLATELKSKLLTTKISERKEKAEEWKNKIENLVLEFKLTQDKSGKVFGSVTKEKIIKELSNFGLELSKGQIVLAKKITEPGEYTIKINLGYEIWANLKVKVLVK